VARPDDVPTAAEVEPVKVAASTAFAFEGMLCVRIDATWRCTEDEWLAALDGRAVLVVRRSHERGRNGESRRHERRMALAIRSRDGRLRA
jgi:hypothetical protein